MTRSLAGWLGVLSVVATACAAAVPSVTDLELSGAVRFVVDGEALNASPEGLPLLVARPGELCTGRVLTGVPGGVKAAPVEALPVAEPALDCVDFEPGPFFPRWSPDGSRVAFMGVSIGSESDIWVFDPVAGATTNLSGDAGEDTLPVWIDNETVAFVRSLESDGVTTTTWQRVEVSGGPPTTIATITGSIELSRGTRVVGTDEPQIVFDIVRPDGVPGGIHRLGALTGELRPLFVPSVDDAAEGWRLIDVHPMGTAALVAVGRGELIGTTVELRIVDLVDGGERVVRPLFGAAIGDARFSSDGLQLLVWELGTEQGDALVVRSTGSDGDGEVLVVGPLGAVGVFRDGATIDVGPDLVLVRIEP